MKRGQIVLVSDWLAQPAALVEGSKLLMPAASPELPGHRPELKKSDLVVMHTHPSFQIGRKEAAMIKEVNPTGQNRFIGAKSRSSLKRAHGGPSISSPQ